MKIKKTWITPTISKISIVRDTKSGLGLRTESSEGISKAQPNRIRSIL
jgi:hypothetical protein